MNREEDADAKAVAKEIVRAVESRLDALNDRMKNLLAENVGPDYCDQIVAVSILVLHAGRYIAQISAREHRQIQQETLRAIEMLELSVAVNYTQILRDGKNFQPGPGRMQ